MQLSNTEDWTSPRSKTPCFMLAMKDLSHQAMMNELMSHCQSWLPVPSPHPSSNSTAKQWYQKWIMVDLWGGSLRVICQKTITERNYGNRPLWRSERERVWRIEERDQAKGSHFGRSGCQRSSPVISVAVASLSFSCLWRSTKISCFYRFTEISKQSHKNWATERKAWEKGMTDILSMLL